ncbi:DUF3365 domain-containing protein, partial [Rhizobium ruizarguesonis]
GAMDRARLLPLDHNEADADDGDEKKIAKQVFEGEDVARVGLTDTLRFITPVVMGQACVACHNTHPESPKTDWKVGDVRGIQEVIIRQPYASN